MRFALDKSHHTFFSKQGYISFDAIFSESECALFREEINRVLALRLKKMTETRSPQELFSVGRDVWRQSEKLSKLTLNRKLGEIASELLNQKAIRIGYDQAFETGSVMGAIIPEPKKLEEVSCFQPIVCAALVRLSVDENSPNLLPKKVGSVLFFRKDFSFPWSELSQEASQCFLLIVYTPAKFRYVLNLQDAHTHELKRMGYAFGDAPSHDTHPYIVK